MTSRQAIAGLIVALLLPLAPLAAGRFFLTGDMRDVYVPLEMFFRKEEMNARLPLWLPTAAWGFPVLAAAQIGFFYPPLLITRLLPVYVYLPLLYTLHLAAAGTGAFLFLRRLNRSPQAATLGALAFALSGFIFQHLTHANIFLATAWLPWQFLAAENAADKFTRRSLALFTLTLGLPFLAGQLQIPLIMAAASSFYFITKARLSYALRLGTVSLLALTAFSISAAQLLPTLELAQQSDRSTSEGFNIERANQHSFPLYHLPTALFPRFFGHDSRYWGKRLEIEYGFFIGTIPLALAAAAAFKRERDTRFFRWLALISFLLALGSLSPFRLLGLEPSLWIFSAPARWLLLTTFTGAVLAAYGYDKLITEPLPPRRLFYLGSTTLIFAAIVYNLFVWLLSTNTPEQYHSLLADQWPAIVANRPAEYYTAKFSQLFESLQNNGLSFRSPFTWLPLLSLGTAAIALRRNKITWLIPATAFELIIIAAATATPTLSWSQALAEPPTSAALPDPVLYGSARLISFLPEGDTGAWLSNPATLATPATREQQHNLLAPLHNTMYNLPGAAWPASLDLAGHSDALDTIRQALRHSNPHPAEEAGIGAVLAPAAQPLPLNVPQKTISDILIYELSPRPTVEFLSSSQPATFSAPLPNLLTIFLPANHPADTLLIRHTYFPGWRATVDGKSTEIKKTGLFRTIEIPANAQTVSLRYRPMSVYIGIALSIVTLAITLTLLLLPPHRTSPPSSLLS